MEMESERHVAYGGRPVRRAYTTWVKDRWKKRGGGKAWNETQGVLVGYIPSQRDQSEKDLLLRREDSKLTPLLCTPLESFFSVAECFNRPG
ncbi:hypothetical protein PspLS_11583 [Pyricularia sp. CBS 133598]|nr:hypothetical protein PspLS_11583 [Pyricularia sp. CBS 133598]